MLEEDKYYTYMLSKLGSLSQNIILEKGRADKMQTEMAVRTAIGDQLNEVLIRYAMPKEEEGGMLLSGGGKIKKPIV